MALTVDSPEPLATFFRQRVENGDQSASDAVAPALMLLEDRDASTDDVEWLREAL